MRTAGGSHGNHRCLPHIRVQIVTLLILLFPALVLLACGVVLLWERGWMLWFLLGSTLSSMPLLWIRHSYAHGPGDTKTDSRTVSPRTPDSSRERTTLSHNGSDTVLPAKADWSDSDRHVWASAIARIRALDLETLAANDVKAWAFDHWSFVAMQYKEGEDSVLHFSLPEALLVLEILSRNYRQFILEKVPAVRDFTIAEAKNIHSTGTRWQQRYTRVEPLWRLARLVVNPVAGAVGEVRSQLLTLFFADLSRTAQNRLKHALLEEISQVAIDLYSGRLRVSDDEISAQLAREEGLSETRAATPLRVFLAGQINAGKSSLVNALMESQIAEVDVLPAGSGAIAYRVQLQEGTELEIVDGPGLGGRDVNLDANVELAVQSDMVLLLSAANQPGKALDLQFLETWREYFETHPARLEPPLLLVTTRNDQLKPLNEWDPPYDLETTRSAKSVNIRDAAAYTREALGLDPQVMCIPIGLPAEGAPYNIDLLISMLSALARDARAAQLNRLRLAASASGPRSHLQVIQQGLAVGRIVGKPLLSAYAAKIRARMGSS